MLELILIGLVIFVLLAFGLYFAINRILLKGIPKMLANVVNELSEDEDRVDPEAPIELKRTRSAGDALREYGKQITQHSQQPAAQPPAQQPMPQPANTPLKPAQQQTDDDPRVQPLVEDDTIDAEYPIVDPGVRPETDDEVVGVDISTKAGNPFPYGVRGVDQPAPGRRLRDKRYERNASD